MSTVSVINYKGGVGKTTVTANLAAELAWRGWRVLLLDLDSQASLTFSFIRPDEWESLEKDRTIKSWFDSFEDGKPIQLSSLVLAPKQVASRLSSRKGELHLIPSHLGLINVDLELATELGGGTMRRARRSFLKVHSRLLDGLSRLAARYDVVLLDCPPNFNIVTKTALVASDFVLIPAKPDYLSTLGIDYLKRNLDELILDFNRWVRSEPGDSREINPQIIGVVFTMIQMYGGQPIQAQRPYIAQTKRLGLPVFDAYIRRNNTVFSNAPEYGVPVALNNFNPGTYRNVVTEIEEFVSEFQGRLA